MNKKIVASIIFSIVISFGLLLVVQNYFPEERIIKEREFYSQDFSLEDELIFLMGSSSVGQLNTTLIHEKVSQKFPQSVVYNLSYNGDTPSERIQTIDDAISLNPKLIICDEAVSALDISTQNTIIKLLNKLKKQLKLSYLFITHDLSVARLIADRILVLKKGEIVELNTAEKIFKSPKNTYTKKLISALDF